MAKQQLRTKALTDRMTDRSIQLLLALDWSQLMRVGEQAEALVKAWIGY